MRRAFSLVELSIVLVILGLLVGGILAGKSLIRAAELRSINADYQRYIAAVHAFRDKYFALPGDITNATSIWGAAHATPATCLTTVGTGTQTCNGNGNAQVMWSANATEYGESFTFWQHMASAGIIEGNYTGRAGAGHARNSVIGTNVPRSKMTNSGWSIEYWGVASAHPSFYNGTYNNIFFFGAESGQPTEAPTLKPEEAWNIDTKLDDGNPAFGKVRPFRKSASASYTNCTTTDVESTTAYQLSDGTVACNLLFITGI